MSVAIRPSHDISSVSLLDRVGDVRAVELLRIAAGPIVLLHLRPFLERSADGIIYSDRFYQPYVPWYPEAPREVYIALLWLVVPAAVALGVGLLTRIAAAYVALFVAYNLFLSQTHFHNNRAFLLVLLVGLALLPLGRRMSVDALVRRAKGRPLLEPEGRLWPLLIMRIEVVAVYLSSALSKLIDPDWFGGTVLRIRFERGREAAADGGVPAWLLDVVTSPDFHFWLAKAAVLTEFAIGLGLVFRRTRLAAIWIAIVFHVTIQVSFSVQVFSYAALAALVIWITPSARDRLVVLRGQTAGVRLLAGSLRWLDWTGRFRVEHSTDSGPAVVLNDRDGTVYRGSAAGRRILTRLPATFFFVAPASLPGLRHVWRRSTAGFFDGAGASTTGHGSR